MRVEGASDPVQVTPDESRFVGKVSGMAVGVAVGRRSAGGTAEALEAVVAKRNIRRVVAILCSAEQLRGIVIVARGYFPCPGAARETTVGGIRIGHMGRRGCILLAEQGFLTAVMSHRGHSTRSLSGLSGSLSGWGGGGSALTS